MKTKWRILDHKLSLWLNKNVAFDYKEKKRQCVNQLPHNKQCKRTVEGGREIKNDSQITSKLQPTHPLDTLKWVMYKSMRIKNRKKYNQTYLGAHSF